jgi:hypothetical protein
MFRLIQFRMFYLPHLWRVSSVAGNAIVTDPIMWSTTELVLTAETQAAEA